MVVVVLCCVVGRVILCCCVVVLRAGLCLSICGAAVSRSEERARIENRLEPTEPTRAAQSPTTCRNDFGQLVQAGWEPGPENRGRLNIFVIFEKSQTFCKCTEKQLGEQIENNHKQQEKITEGKTAIRILDTIKKIALKEKKCANP